MNDDLESLLGSLTPRGAPPELRSRVLAAVAQERETTRRPARRRFPAWTATAAALVVAGFLNHMANRSDEERLARAFGPRPVSPEAVRLARDVAEAAGPEAGRWLLERLTTPGRPATRDDLIRHAAEIERLSRETILQAREPDHETTPRPIPQVGRDRRRPPAGRLLAGERRLHLDDRPTA